MLTRCVACGGELKTSKVQGLGVCPTCKHYCHRKPLGTAKYNEVYKAKYELYAKTDLGKKINATRWGLVCRYLKGHEHLLDYGCGTGAFLRSSPNGFRCAGYDINPFIPYKETPWGYTWDGVSMWDVLEHMYRPDEFIKQLETRFLFLLVPDVTHAPRDVTKWKHFKGDEHQHLFSQLSVVTMLERCGYKVREINRDEAILRDPKHPSYLVTVVAEKA